MASRSAHRGISVIVFLSAALLIFRASIVQYDGQALNLRSNRPVKALQLVTDPIPAEYNLADGASSRPGTIETQYEHRPLTDDNELKKRVVTLSWPQALKSGQESLDLLDGPRQQSRWTSTRALRNNGWRVIDEFQEQVEEFYSDPGGAYEKLGIDSKGDHEVEARHDFEYSNCYHRYLDATRASFTEYYNVPGRTIVAVSNYGPKYRLTEEPPSLSEGRPPKKERMPELYAWSDIVWLLWADRAERLGQPPSSLKYVFRYDVVTENTRFILNLAAPMDGATWPGHEFKKGSEEFKALLGTPHRKGIAFLIATHPNEMPGKDIESINTFVTRRAFGIQVYHMLFTLTD